MSDNRPLKIAVLPGDGIGAEVTEAALPIFKALDLPVTLQFGDIGWQFWQTEGNALPLRTIQLLKNSDVCLLGATTSKPQKEALEALNPAFRDHPPAYVSPLIQLRQGFDLYASLRPCYQLFEHNHQAFDFTIIRENTEGLYAGLDFSPLPEAILSEVRQQSRWQRLQADEACCSLRLQTAEGLKRLFDFAFKQAEIEGKNRLSLADKPNVLRQSAAFSREIFESVAENYPHIAADIVNVDALAHWLIKKPERFGIVVAENMFGDILADVGAAVMGGLGFAPSANIGRQGSYFEPVHGSGLHMKANTANPSAMFLSISLLLSYSGFPEAAKIIKAAVKKVLNEGIYRSYDMGGKNTTREMAEQIILTAVNLS